MDIPKQVKDEIADFINANRDWLPININHWYLQISKVSQKEDRKLSFGKYNASTGRTAGFYKHISRIVNYNPVPDE